MTKKPTEKDSGSSKNFTPPSADLIIDPLLHDLPIVRVLPQHLAYISAGVHLFRDVPERDYQILYSLLLEIPRLPDAVRRALLHAAGRLPDDEAHAKQDLDRQLLQRAIDRRQRELDGGRGSRTQAIADTAIRIGITAQALKRRLFKRPRRREATIQTAPPPPRTQER
jgi:hypothetical protein